MPIRHVLKRATYLQKQWLVPSGRLEHEAYWKPLG